MFDLFKSLFKATPDSSVLLLEARDLLLEMLDKSDQLLVMGLPTLLNKDQNQGLLDTARSIDKDTNRLERSIRKILVEHLSFDISDAPACLVLMSVAKDAERMTDLLRDVIGLGLLSTEDLPEKYLTPIREMYSDIEKDLKTTRSAFADNLAEKAFELVEGEKPFNRLANEFISGVLDDNELNSRQIVVADRACSALIRLRAHLGNIASTVVFPVHRIDFVKKQFIHEAKEELAKLQK
ncbi:MAG: PhoU domain-containing protein [Planctomycetes bacterium]|nr:PhoU domain-containing protein [Planctomycetota bacterium]